LDEGRSKDDIINLVSPRVTDALEHYPLLETPEEMLLAGGISKRQAALELGIGHATLLRQLEEYGRGDLVERRGMRVTL